MNEKSNNDIRAENTNYDIKDWCKDDFHKFKCVKKKITMVYKIGGFGIRLNVNKIASISLSVHTNFVEIDSICIHDIQWKRKISTHGPLLDQWSAKKKCILIYFNMPGKSKIIMHQYTLDSLKHLHDLNVDVCL